MSVVGLMVLKEAYNCGLRGGFEFPIDLHLELGFTGLGVNFGVPRVFPGVTDHDG